MSQIPDRRSFLLGAASGLLVAGGAAGLWALAQMRRRRVPPVTGLFLGKPGRHRAARQAMPGLYPGSVVEVRDPRSVTADNRIVAEVVAAMVDRGMAELVGGDPRDVAGVWKTFFGPDDYVGIKVNPVGRKPLPGEGRNPNAIGAISSPALLVRVVECLKAAGVKAERIYVFERYADEFVASGYADLMTSRPMDGVRWLASSASYSNSQVAIDGFDAGRDSCSPELARHVVGYDPDAFTTMGYCSKDHDPKDDRRFRSHLSAIVTQLVGKIITLPVLKDHRSAGVTLSLKNMSHGMNNNVARSHLPIVDCGLRIADWQSPSRGATDPEDAVLQAATRRTGPNQCNTFIPQAVSQEILRQKATLHILDGLIGVYEGGPGSWNKTWATWRHGGLFFATDPVALDHVGWSIVDDKRRAMGWPAVGKMGLQNYPYDAHIRAALASFTMAAGIPAATLALASQNLLAGRASEVFDRRQPEHIVLAGEMGLGKFDRAEIAYRRIG